VLPEALPSGQALLDLLDLPGVYSKLIGGIREPVANSKGLLSILAPATVATRGELVESIERQLSRPFGQDLNVANAFLNVAQTRANEALRRRLTVYGEGRIPKRGYFGRAFWLRAFRSEGENPPTPQGSASHRFQRLCRTLARPTKLRVDSLLRPLL
jgi:hypothetical protein